MWPKVSVSLIKKWHILFIQEKLHASKSFRKIYLLKAESAKLDIKRRKLGILFIRIRLRFSHSKYLLHMIIFCFYFHECFIYNIFSNAGHFKK